MQVLYLTDPVDEGEATNMTHIPFLIPTPHPYHNTPFPSPPPHSFLYLTDPVDEAMVTNMALECRLPLRALTFPFSPSLRCCT